MKHWRERERQRETGLISRMVGIEICRPSMEEGLKVTDANLVVYVHPSKQKNVSQAILREMSSLLFKFSEVFYGVVLAYDVQILDNKAKILPLLHPYFGVKLKATLLLFSPKPDMLLEGKVVKVAHESIHIIVLGFSSAIITEENIRNEFKFKIKHGKEVFVSRFHKRHVIKVGTMIRFSMKSLDEEILHMFGSLIPPQTGNIVWLDKNLEEGSVADRHTNKRREDEERSEVQDHDTEMVDAGVNSNYRSKKSKRRRVKEA